MKRYQIFWSINISTEEAFSFGDLYERLGFEPSGSMLKLTQASLSVADFEEYIPSKLQEYAKIKEEVDQRERGVQKEKPRGVALQVAIFDEIAKKRKKFLLTSLSQDTQSSTVLDVYFDGNQIPLTTFELKGKTYFDKTNCMIQLQGYYMFSTNEPVSVNMVRHELVNNQHAAISEEVVRKRKEIMRLQHAEKVEKEKEVELETVPIEDHSGPKIFTKDGVIIREIFVGHGRKAQKGDKVLIKFQGKLDPEKRKTFDRTSLRHPYSYVLGTKKVLSGINIAVEGMTLNGKREVIIPPQHGFGLKGYQDIVPSNATLYYDIELVGLVPKKQHEEESKKASKEKQKQREEKAKKKKEVPDIIEL